MKRYLSLLSLFLLVAASFMPALSRTANAAAVTAYTIELSEIEENLSTNVTFEFTNATAVDASTDTIIFTVTISSLDFAVNNIVFGDVDLEVNGTDKTLAATAAASTWGFARSGAHTLTFTAPTNATLGEIAAGSVVTIKVGTHANGGTNKVGTPNVASDQGFEAAISGTFGDTGNGEFYILNSATNNQVAATATVDEYLTFAISDTAVSMGTLSSAAPSISAEGATATISTNATGGWEMYVRGLGQASNPGLLGDNYSDLIASSTATLSAGTEGYGLQCQDGASNFCNSDYDSDTATNRVGIIELDDVALSKWASNTSQASSVAMTYEFGASISTTTIADSYTDTVRLSASGIW